jgi:hypothetical protein
MRWNHDSGRQVRRVYGEARGWGRGDDTLERTDTQVWIGSRAAVTG